MPRLDEILCPKCHSRLELQKSTSSDIYWALCVCGRVINYREGEIPIVKVDFRSRRRRGGKARHGKQW